VLFDFDKTIIYMYARQLKLSTEISCDSIKFLVTINARFYFIKTCTRMQVQQLPRQSEHVKIIHVRITTSTTILTSKAITTSKCTVLYKNKISIIGMFHPVNSLVVDRNMRIILLNNTIFS